MICHMISVYTHLFWKTPESATPLSKGHHQASGTMKTKYRSGLGYKKIGMLCKSNDTNPKKIYFNSRLYGNKIGQMPRRVNTFSTHCTLVGWLTTWSRLQALVTVGSFFLSEQLDDSQSIFKSSRKYTSLLISHALSCISHIQCLAKVFGPLELWDLLPPFRLQT